LFSSDAQLLVFTNVVVSVISISKSILSSHAGSIIVFLSPSPAVSLAFKCHTVVSVALTATYWSAPLAAANVLSVTGQVSLSWNVIGAGVTALLAVKTKSHTLAFNAVVSALLFTESIISFQKA